MKHQSRWAVLACLLFGCALASPIALAERPSCPCNISDYMDLIEEKAGSSFDSWQSCELINNEAFGSPFPGAREYRASLLKTDGGTVSWRLGSSAIGKDAYCYSGFTIEVGVEYQTSDFATNAQYRACADDFIVECSARLNP